MVKLPKYKFLPDVDVDLSKTCPIEILDGEFKGIVYRYGHISLKELENEGISVNMDIEIITGPKDFDKTQQNFTNSVGEIFVDIVEKKVGEEETVDLEDDVHQD
jgi:hypothetical protein